DRVGRALADGWVVRAVDPKQLIAEEERARGAVSPLAELVEADALGICKVHQPLEMGRVVPITTAVYGAFGADDLRIDRLTGRGRCMLALEHDAQLVHQDLFARS